MRTRALGRRIFDLSFEGVCYILTQSRKPSFNARLPRPCAMPGREALSTIAVALVETGGLQFGRFTLSSGKASSYYIDLRRIPSFPRVYKKVVRAYRLLVREVGAESFDVVAGIATSGLT